MRTINIIALILILIGALNWGLVGFFDYNLVDVIFGEGSVVARVIYALVGVAGLYKIVVALGSRMMKQGA